MSRALDALPPKLLVGFAALLATLAAALIVSSYLKERELRHWVTHTREVIDQVRDIRLHLAEAELNRRGSLLTGGEGDHAAMTASGKAAADDAAELARLVSDNPLQSARAAELQNHVNATIFVKGPPRAGDPATAGRPLLDDLRGVHIDETLAELESEERRLVVLRRTRADEAQQLTLTWALLIVGTAGATLTAAAYVVLTQRRARLTTAHALAESESLYRLLAENSNDMIVRLGLDGTRRYVSPACRSLLGFEPEELIGGSPASSIHVEDRQRVIDVCRSLLSGAQQPMCSYRQQHRDGRYVWLEASYRLVRDASGQPTEIVANVRDVSRRQAMERDAALAAARAYESHRLLVMAAGMAKVGHWRFDIVRNELSWSEETSRIYGVDPEDVPTPAMALDACHPEDRPTVAAELRSAAREGRSVGFTARLRSLDGALRTVRVQGQAERAPSGEVIELFGVIQDVTDHATAEAALRESELRYRFISERAMDVIATLDLQARCTHISPSIRDLTGYSPKALIGVDILAVMHPEDAPDVARLYAELVRGDTDHSVAEYRTRHRDGSWFWVEASLRLVRDAEGAPSEVISVVRDLSQRKQLEAELTNARDRAEAAAQAKADFLANMSHEIRTPLNGILGFAELLDEANLPPEPRRWVGRIRSATSDLGMLLNDILDVSKIEAGRLEVASEPIDLRNTVEGATQLLSSAADQKGLTLKLTIDPDLPKVVLGDSLRLRQILLNLVGNAVKFTEDGSVAVSVREAVGPAGRLLQVDVRDTGIGMTAEALARVFDNFAQADSSITRRFGGTGLGLTISRSLAKLMGGDLTLESAPGLGTRARLQVPLMQGELAPEMPSKSRSTPKRTGRILVVDDVEMNREVVSLLLIGAGHQVELASGGEEAVARVRRTTYDLVLMDMQMPEVDGLEATRRIRALPDAQSRTPILAFTANAMPEQVLACRKAGMNGHVSKPVKRNDLLSAVDAWLKDEPRPAPASSGGLEDQLAALSRAYVPQLLSQSERLAALTGAADADLVVPEIKALAHGVAGTAGSLGFAAVSAAAFKLQDAAMDFTPDRVRDLRDAAAALQTEIGRLAQPAAA